MTINISPSSLYFKAIAHICFSMQVDADKKKFHIMSQPDYTVLNSSLCLNLSFSCIADPYILQNKKKRRKKDFVVKKSIKFICVPCSFINAMHLHFIILTCIRSNKKIQYNNGNVCVECNINIIILHVKKK